MRLLNTYLQLVAAAFMWIGLGFVITGSIFGGVWASGILTAALGYPQFVVPVQAFMVLVLGSLAIATVAKAEAQ